jgi:hypothetical protein
MKQQPAVLMVYVVEGFYAGKVTVIRVITGGRGTI